MFPVTAIIRNNSNQKAESEPNIELGVSENGETETFIDLHERASLLSV